MNSAVYEDLPSTKDQPIYDSGISLIPFLTKDIIQFYKQDLSEIL